MLGTLVATRDMQELYKLEDGSAVIVDHDRLQAFFPPSIEAALKQGYWETPSDDDGLIFTEKHLSGQHDQQTHARGGLSSMSDSDIEKKRRDALRIMDEIEASNQIRTRNAEYEQAVKFINDSGVERDHRRALADAKLAKIKTEAYTAVIAGDASKVSKLKGDAERVIADKPAATTQRGTDEPQLQLQAAGSHTGPLRSEADYQAMDERLRRGFGDGEYSRERIAKEKGYNSVEEMEESFLRDVNTLITDSNVAMNVPDRVLGQILQGGFKNIHATKATLGMKSAKRRAFTEEQMFGIPKGSTPDKYPLYGYLQPRSVRKSVVGDSFGNTTIIFKNSIKGRSTISNGDTLGNERYMLPAPMTRPRMTISTDTRLPKVVSVKGDRPDAAAMASRTHYWETQIHGPTTYRDIESVRFSNPPDPGVVFRLEELGIPYEVG